MPAANQPAPLQSGLILASTSRYRADLLSRLRIPFQAIAPDVEERRLDGESPSALAVRLAEAKASAVHAEHPTHWVIGSDQVAALGDVVLGKPGAFEPAAAQLRASSGRSVAFLTAWCLLGPGGRFQGLDRTLVRFRELDEREISRYLQLEQPYDCAGAFKCEALGISLFEAIETRDPTALIGLPLIALADALRKTGFALP